MAKYKVSYSRNDGLFHPCDFIECAGTKLEGDNFVCYDYCCDIVAVFNTKLTLIKSERIIEDTDVSA